MSRVGWFKIWRKLEEHWLWKEKPFSSGQAWIDLLLRTNFTDSVLPDPGRVGPAAVQPGEAIISLRSLEVSWGWSRHRVIRFIKCLKNEHMIDTTNETTFTRLKVLNWKSYQVLSIIDSTTSGTTDDTAYGTRNGTTIGTRTGTPSAPIRRSKEIQEGKEGQETDIAPNGAHPSGAVAQALVDLWNHGKAKAEWIRITPKRIAKTSARLKDGFTPEQLQTAVGNCLKSEWHQGANDRGWKAAGPEWVLHSTEKTEEWIKKVPQVTESMVDLIRRAGNGQAELRPLDGTNHGVLQDPNHR